MDKARHLKFGVTILFLLFMAGVMAMSSPADFDLDVVWKFLLIFGGVAFGILGLGYLSAPKKPVVDQIDALEGRRHDDRLR